MKAQMIYRDGKFWSHKKVMYRDGWWRIEENGHLWSFKCETLEIAYAMASSPEVW